MAIYKTNIKLSFADRTTLDSMGRISSTIYEATSTSCGPAGTMALPPGCAHESKGAGEPRFEHDLPPDSDMMAAIRKSPRAAERIEFALFDRIALHIDMDAEYSHSDADIWRAMTRSHTTT